VTRRPPADREQLARAQRIVVKVGSSSLTTREGGLDAERLDALVATLAKRRADGGEVVLVSSGAIAAGLAPLGRTVRPRDLATQQAAASVGQGLLLASYAEAFGARGLTVGQICDRGRRDQARSLRQCPPDPVPAAAAGCRPGGERE
jgi:glutamate 5-kinase